MKIIYTMPNGKLAVSHPQPKEKFEEILGKLTDEQYKKEVWVRAVPDDAINPVWVEDNIMDWNDRSKRHLWYQDGAIIKIREE